MKIFKNILCALCLLLASVMHVRGQILPPSAYQDPCTPMILCGGGTTTPGAYTGNPSANTAFLSPSCCPGFYNVVFWQVTIATSGVFVFSLTPLNACEDYDFIVYKIDPNLPCPANLSAAVPVRCDANDIFSSPGGSTGLSTSAPIPGLWFQPAGAGPAFLDSLHVLAGEVYLIAIQDAGTYGCPFGTAPGPVNISFAGSTAVFLDSVSPAYQLLIPTCNIASGVVVQMNEQIQCNSIAANGSDFTVSGGGTVSAAVGIGCTPGALATQILVSFFPPLPAGNYVLRAKVGTDGNTLLDVCDTPQHLPDSLLFTVPQSIPLSFIAISPPSCSRVVVAMSGKVDCDSLAKDGSDFIITGPQNVSIIGAFGMGCDSNHFVDTIVILLKDPIQTDGTYTLAAQKGIDNNTQVDTCFHYQNVGNSITFNINTYDGKILAAPDTILCKQGYIRLQSQNNATPPGDAIVCGPATVPCSAFSMHYPAIGKDSLSSANSPFYAFGKSRLQFIYTADELKSTGAMPGTINSIAWRVMKLNTGTVTFTNFTIKMSCTNTLIMNNAFISGTQVVYSVANYNANIGWNIFNLSTPFNWDGINSIVVEVCYDNATSSAVADVVENSVSNYNSVFHLSAPASAASGCTLEIGSGGIDNGNHRVRPKTRFTMCLPPAGNSSNLNYLWAPSDYMNSATIPNPRVYVLNSTTYHVKTVDNDGCLHQDTAVVKLSKRLPFITPKDTAICYGRNILMTAGGGIQYAWSAQDAGTLFTCNTCNMPVVTPDTSGKLQVIISDQYNCSDTLFSNITVFPTPLVQAYPADTIVNYGAIIQLRASGAIEYLWTPAYLIQGNTFVNPQTEPILKPVDYIVYGFDEHGCSSTDTARINVRYDAPIFIPSAFTPNHDGKNDVFKVAGVSYHKIIEFRVFNRWGQEVFNTTDAQSGWDGTWKGVKQDMGAYFYLISVTYPDGKLKTFTGEVTLIR